MLPALGALASVLDALQTPTSSKTPSSQTAGFSQAATNPFDPTASAASGSPSPASCHGGCSQISPATLSALLAAQGQSTTAPSAPTSQPDALKDLFSLLDANSDGQVSKSEFENALGAGGTNLAQADDVFSKLDRNGDGSVSLGELTSALKGAGGKGHHHHHHVAGSDGSGAAGDTGSTDGSSDPLLQALSGASSTQVANSDGTTTTSVTYADGSPSSPATKSSSTATASYNFIERLIQREAQAISSGATAALSLNV